ncbi:MAG TPA: alpha/beta fold hydrolase [Chloroflexia bacterium]|jgi:pimeloyl-ACP methyl ester carboxylesterase
MPTLHHEERGEGMPLVLVHGFPFDSAIWRAQLEDLSGDARVIALDLPGFGGSGPLPGDEASIDGYADAIARWAGEVGLVKLTLAGHSMGGYVVLAFARRYAGMLAGLGLVCTRPGPDSEQARQGRYTMIENVQKQGPQAVVDAMLPRLLSPRTREQRPEVEEQTREVMLRQSSAGIIAALQAMASRPDSSPYLAQIRVPTAVIGGADDAIIAATDEDLMAATIPGATQVRIQGAGHMPMLEQPQRLSDALRNLVRGSTTLPPIPGPADPHNIEGIRRHD